MQALTSLRRWPRLVIVVVVAAFAGAGAVAYASGGGPSSPDFTPQKADQITNIDILRQQIKNYYGDPSGTGIFAPDSNYARETESVAAAGSRWLAARAHGSKSTTSSKKGNETSRHSKRGNETPMQAIVLDVDDTTLATWNYEIFSNWAYSPSTNAVFVLGQEFPAVPGMVEMVTQAADEGYAVFYITGRHDTQEAATLGNLTSDGVGVDAGYPDPTTLPDGTDGLFTKPDATAPPSYLTCGTSCTTVEYKSLTRKYIESEGYDIVANFGDQYSDLEGGYADRTFKMPNPNYYLP